MDITTKQKIAKSSFGILVALLLFFSAGINIPVLDVKTDIYFDEAMTKAVAPMIGGIKTPPVEAQASVAAA